MLLFVPGAKQSILSVEMEGIDPVELYQPLMDTLVSMGFVVVAIDPPNENWFVSERTRALFCAAMWVQPNTPGGWSERANNRLSCDIVVSGHSRGGEAAFKFTDSFNAFLASGAIPENTQLRAMFALAPRSRANPPVYDEPSRASSSRSRSPCAWRPPRKASSARQPESRGPSFSKITPHMNCLM